MNHQFSQYKNFRDSGVDWLDNMPSHWGLKRVKEVAEVNNKTLTEKTPDDYEFEYVDIGSVTYGVKGYATEVMTFGAAPSRARRIVKKGDTIISTVRTYLKAITSIETDMPNLIVSTGFAVITPNKKLHPKFSAYWLMSDLIVDRVYALSTGVSYPAVNASIIGDLFFFIPPLEEQQAIADYLDAKTSQIDRKIELLEGKAEKYTDLKQSLINKTVTRGLDKNVPMKDSGVVWIGQIPSHWVVKQFKQFATMKGRIGWQGLKNSEFTDNVDSPFLITGMNFKDGKIRWNEVYHISNERYQQAPEIQLKKNDILMTKDGTIGKLLFIDEIPYPHKASLNSHLLVIRPIKNRYFSRFMFYQLHSASFTHYAEISKSGTTFFGLSQEATERYIAVLPPIEEQKAIAEYLDAKTAHIEKIIETIHLEIEKFQELRKTLVNDVVTGKIMVYQA